MKYTYVYTKEKFPCVKRNKYLQHNNLNLLPCKYSRRLFLSVTSAYILFMFECVNCSSFMHKIQALKNEHFISTFYIIKLFALADLISCD